MPLPSNIIFDPKQASEGKYRSVQRFSGDLADMERTEVSTFGSTQIVMKFENVTIERMKHNMEMPELKDNSYTIYVPYTNNNGDVPGKNSMWIKGVCASAAELKMDWPPKSLPVTGVTMEQKEIKLFSTKDLKTQVKSDVIKEGWVFVPSDGSCVAAPDDYVRALVVGANPTAALRALMLDPKTQDMSCRDELNNGTFAAKYGLRLNEAGVFEVA